MYSSLEALHEGTDDEEQRQDRMIRLAYIALKDEFEIHPMRIQLILIRRQMNDRTSQCFVFSREGEEKLSALVKRYGIVQ